MTDNIPAKWSRAGPGRRPLLTPAVEKIIIEAIECGVGAKPVNAPI